MHYSMVVWTEIINATRMDNESMYNANNQSKAVCGVGEMKEIIRIFHVLYIMRDITI